MSEEPRKLLIEGALIVASILVAFAIDAWWDERQERVEERRILESLLVEFRENAVHIPNYQKIHIRAASGLETIVRELHAAGPGGQVEVPVIDIGMAVSHASTDPLSSTLDAVLQSGELRYIQNEALRAQLVRWPRDIIDATENEVLLREIWDPKLHEALARVADMSPLLLMAHQCWSEPDLPKCSATKVTVPYDRLSLGLMGPVLGYTTEANRELGLLVETAQEIAEMIEQELASM